MTSHSFSTNTPHILFIPNSKSRATNMAHLAGPSSDPRFVHVAAIALTSLTVRSLVSRAVSSIRTGVPGFHSSCVRRESNKSSYLSGSALPDNLISKKPSQCLKLTSKVHLLSNGPAHPLRCDHFVAVSPRCSAPSAAWA